jgi:hypothetical protein
MITSDFKTGYVLKETTRAKPRRTEEVSVPVSKDKTDNTTRTVKMTKGRLWDMRFRKKFK